MSRLALLFALFLGPYHSLLGAPNILLIVSDDQGFADLGCLGNTPLKTPHLDRLASEGVRLTNFYVTWPACTPSRGSLLTGRYPQRNGIFDMIRNEAPDYGHRYTPAEYESSFERIGGMDPREVLLPALLKQKGYLSAIYGKWDLGALERFLPLARGFDDFYGFVNTGIDYYTHERYGVPSMYRNNTPTTEDEGTYCTHLFEREALRFLAKVAGRRTTKPSPVNPPDPQSPFFLYLPFNAPHSASNLDPKIRSGAQAPLEYRDLYPFEGPRYTTIRRKRYASGTPFAEATESLTREARIQEYRASITCMDESIGKILAFLDQHDLARDTIVIFFSDNGGGGSADNSPLRGGKGDMWEGGIRVPCIVRWPRGRIPAGTVSDEFLTSLEILPTLCAQALVEVPEGISLDGFNMIEVLRGKQPSPRHEMFWQRKDQVGARVKNWKWVRQKKGGGLFDLAHDPGESHDLSEERPEILKMVHARYQAWRKSMDQAEPRGPFRNF